MGASQIKGHRIAERQIENKHLHENFKLPEEKLVLNYKTHDNSGDLTVAQKNTLTQMGNADGLHFHTGGGGGPQGIYTNEERDVQLLKLAMLINATKYGMDKSVQDGLDNDDDIDYGIKPAAAPVLSNITDGPELGTLKANATYSYGVAFKTKYGKTNVTNGAAITTNNGANNSVQLNIVDVPPQNTGMEVYRCEGTIEKLIVENEKVSEWDNPNNYEMNVEGSDKTSGYGSVKVNLKGYNTNGTVSYPSVNIASGVGKRVISAGEALNTVLTKSTPIYYYIGVNNKGVCNRLDLVWGRAPSNVPLDYEVYYTTDTIINDVDAVNWNKFERLVKVRGSYGNALNVSTDGQITDNYKVTNNTRPYNNFLFKSVPNITAIKIVVTKVQQNCSLDDLRLWTENNSALGAINKDFGTPQAFSAYGTLKMDVKSNLSHSNIKTQLLKGTEAVTNTVSEWSLGSTANYALTGNTLRCRVGDSTYRNRYGTYDRIRVAIRVPAGAYVKFENVFLHVDGRSHDHQMSYCDPDTPETVVPLTFNGNNYYEGTPTSANNLIWSDWVPIKFPNKNVYAYYVTLTVVSGGLMYNTNTYSYTWYSNNNVQGLEADKWLDTVSSSYINSLADWSFVEQVQAGTSNAKPLTLDLFNANALNKWHRHYLPLPAGVNSDDIKKLQIYFDNLLVDQDLYIDNISLSKAKEVLNQVTGATVVASNGGLNIGNLKVSTNSAYYESDLAPTNTSPKMVMVSVPTPVDINKLILYFGFNNFAGLNYALEYTVDTTADVNDAYGDPKWLPVESLSIGEPGIPSEFTGSVVGNIIYDNNIWDTHITHNFKSVNALKFRVVFFATIGGAVVRISNMKVMTTETIGDLKKIYETSTPVVENQVLIDDGKAASIISPSEFNTTGSYNVYYDNVLKVMKLIDKTKQGTVYFNEVNLGLYISIILTAQVVGNISFYVSNDSGATFEPITLDRLFTFTNQSNSLIIKAELLSADAALSAIAFLYSL
jgi:hypothetical protein